MPFPTLKLLQLLFLPDKQSGFLQFIQGKLDFTSGLDSYKDEILTQKGELQPDYVKVNLITGPVPQYTEYLGFNG
jgi:peptide/nickel transport system substrate-binding protein